MNKNRGIWITIVMITIIGVMVTWGTKRFVNKESGVFETAASSLSLDSNDIVSEAEDKAPDAENTASTENSRMRAATEAGQMEEEALSSADDPTAPVETPKLPNEEIMILEKSSYEAAGNPFEKEVIRQDSVVISPLDPGNGASGGSGESDASGNGDYYRKRLEEVDAQIQKMRAETSDSSTYTVQALADQELKLWNDELGVLYSAIAENLDDSSLSSLETSQQAWLKERDKKAEAAARKYSGGSLEGVEYTAALAGSTRQRAYDLAGEYGSALSSGE